MERDLAEINAIPGVRGSFIYNNSGEVLIILCQPGIEMPTLRLTLNVVAARLKGYRQLTAKAINREIVENEMDEVSRNLLEVLRARGYGKG